MSGTRGDRVTSPIVPVPSQRPGPCTELKGHTRSESKGWSVCCQYPYEGNSLPTPRESYYCTCRHNFPPTKSSPTVPGPKDGTGQGLKYRPDSFSVETKSGITGGVLPATHWVRDGRSLDCSNGAPTKGYKFLGGGTVSQPRYCRVGSLRKT